MRIMICGVGQVGSSIARHLAADGNDVTVVDISEDLARRASEALEVRTVIGHAAHPDILEEAGAEDCDMMIAVTNSDEVNMVACQIGYSLFKIPTRIARVRDQSYLHPRWQDLFRLDHLPIDVVISPEIEVAHAIRRRLQAPGAIEMMPFADNKVKLVGVHCQPNAPLANLPIRLAYRRAQDVPFRIVGLDADGRYMLPRDDHVIQPGNDVYFLCEAQHLEKVTELFGLEQRPTKRLVIVGGGNIGLFLARQLEQDDKNYRIKLIEHDPERAAFIEGQLQRSTVIQGSGLDQAILDEAQISRAGAVIAVTNNDEVNVMSSLLAKKQGCQRSVALVNSSIYQSLLGTLGVDVLVNPRETTVSSILQHVRRGKIRSVHAIHDGAAEVIETEALETSSVVGKSLDALDLPIGIEVGVIVRKGEVIFPTGETEIHANDRVIFCALAGQMRKLESIFSVSLEYF